MRNNIISVLLLSGALTLTKAAASQKDISLSCLLFKDLSFYDIRSLKAESLDYTVQDEVNSQIKYHFNVCGLAKNACEGAAPEGTFAYKKDESTEKCSALTGNVETLNKMESENGENYLEMSYEQAADKTCLRAEGQELVSYKFALNIKCNSEANSTDFLERGIVDASDPCFPKITIEHQMACPVFAASTFSKFFSNNPAILGIVAVAFGLIVAVYGRKFFPMTIFASGSVFGFGVTVLLFTMLSMFETKADKKDRIELTVAGTILSYLASLCVGVFVGFILQRMLKIGAAIIGAVGGFFIAIPISNLLFSWADSEILLKVISVLAALAMALLSLKQYDNIVIFGTSVLGSYLFIRGFSFFIKDSFPSEDVIFEKIASGDVSSIFYVYLAVFVGLVGFGVFYQQKQRQMELLTNFIKL